MIQYQTLDINSEKTKRAGSQEDGFGNKILFSTVGGQYILPIDETADSVKIIAYIHYDKNGMAKITDYRICGFVQRHGQSVTDRREE